MYITIAVFSKIFYNTNIIASYVAIAVHCDLGTYSKILEKIVLICMQDVVAIIKGAPVNLLPIYIAMRSYTLQG